MAAKAKKKATKKSSPAKAKKKAAAKKKPAAAKTKTKKTKAKAAPKKVKAAPKKEKAAVAAKAEKNTGPEKKTKTSKKAAEREARKNQAAEALQAALEDSDTTAEEDEFDPEAFFAASGGKGLFRSHVMRKERVDFQTDIRFRAAKDPIVTNATLLNLSKGGLCLRTPKTIKDNTVLRVEIPLPHTSELFSIQAEVIWSHEVETDTMPEGGAPIHTGLRFMTMSLAKQTVINNFIQQRRDELIMAKIGLDKFTDSVPVAGID
ncbi:hypothetical protein GW915_08180 [bacterium]|nr:hypothetical protein [bacterium]